MKQHKFALFPNFTLSPSKFIGKIISWLRNGHKKQMHYDVTLHDVTAIINQIYSYFEKGCRKNVHATTPKGNMG